ncbi:MAG: EAL domain-containing protein [Gammaproteobacteria bacterium]|nr:EAL domain-containing protein [Gammaproteobacteria bacterium]
MNRLQTEAVRVLLIEDTLGEADLIREMLRRASGASFLIEHARRLTEAWPHLESRRHDVVLLDLNLPDSDGLSGFEKLHKAAPWLPVIILTNVKNEEVAARAVRFGAQDYLIKREVDTNLLTRAIRYAIERQRAEEALRESEQRYALAVAGANDGLWDWDLRRGRIYFSPRWKSILGYGPEEIGDQTDEWFKRVHPDDVDGLKAVLSSRLAEGTEHFSYEHRVMTKSGQALWVLCRGLVVRDENGEGYRAAGSLTDISQRKRAEAQLIHDAMHDALTGLPNRSLCLDRLNVALRQVRRDEHKAFAVLFFDLDRFKTINDSLGHTVGDQLLVGISRRLEKYLRPGDTLARLGGDEFAILLNEIEGVSDATHVAERIHQLLEGEFIIEGHEVFTTASIGIAMGSDQYRRAEDVLRDADLAMYRAKRAGNLCYEVFDGNMHEDAVALLTLETDLRRAVERDEFVVHYQPIVSLVTERVLGFEALLRWKHPERGLLLPDEFIHAAEETGLIIPIGWRVLMEACHQTRVWQKLFPTDPPLAISINISGKLFQEINMSGKLLGILEDSGLAAESLRLEITESAIMDHRETALEELMTLRESGIQLHIDDFGTGYSSLTYLQRFAYDTLKIDRSFVGAMNSPGETGAIVKAIVALGKMLNMNVIAEGVETEEQLQWLRSIHCPEAQGFWFSEPMDELGVDTLLRGKHGKPM